ncbi:MAG: class I SAM-dependent rRNA methyltransferase [Candidatus Omnitrophica bacterium]|nr:class I SAM-dependent rRNA methyltransferase [Candidatus Omnitrophota bacterium]
MSIVDLLKSAVKKRESFRAYTNAIRLVNGVGDKLDGLVLEQYDQYFVAQIFDRRWFKEKVVLIELVKELGGKYFVVKDRGSSASSQSDDIKREVWIEVDTSKTVVEEQGLKFEVDLNDTLNTGLFLDMRHNRKTVAELARGRKVLNCFAYTCSFGVYCRAAGAVSVINVDVSKKCLDRGRKNYELNNIVSEPNEFIKADAVEYLTKAVKKENRFDLIILDPPSFSRCDGKTFSVKKDMACLIKLAVKVLNPGGVLFAAVNFSEMTAKDLEFMVVDAKLAAGIKNIKYLKQDKDFIGTGLVPESYLAAVLVELK